MAKPKDYDGPYSDPELRARLKDELQASTRGGPAGTWSARKSQLLTLAYERAGGRYRSQADRGKPARPPTRPPAVERTHGSARLAAVLEGYDALTVDELRERLQGLSAGELAQIRSYESDHKARAGALRAIDVARRRAQ